MKKLYALLFVFLFSINFTNAQDGSLDLSFGTAGSSIHPIGIADDIPGGMCVLADGKILVAGTANITSPGFVLARYLSNGNIDSTFGVNGIVLTSFGDWPMKAEAYCMAVQTDGKIILAGKYSNGTTTDIALVRYLVNGQLDSTFDDDGKVITPLTTSLTGAMANAINIQPDGKIVVTGEVYGVGTSKLLLLRYNTNGSLDLSFDLDGKVEFDALGYYTRGDAIAFLPDGKILVAGVAEDGWNYEMLLMRFNSDGSIDDTFDTDGMVLTNTGSQQEVNGLILQTDGKMTISGSIYPAPYRDFMVTRYKADGSLDLTFDSDGIVITDFGGGDDIAYTMAQQVDGKIVLGGVYIPEFTAIGYFALSRYLVNGSLDTTFNNDGKVIDFLGGSIAACGIQSDQKIVVAGVYSDGSDFDFALARYMVDNTISIYEIQGTNNSRVFPNPSNSTINLQVEKSFVKASARIVDVSGQIVFTQYNLNGNNFSFDVSGFTNGIYFLELKSLEGVERVKFVKE